MPYQPLGLFDPDIQLPQQLQHKPVYALPYQQFENPFGDVTDVRYISVGISQYDPQDISVKTMRRVADRWTRQAEELPLHRAVDVVLFLTAVVTDRDAESGNVTFPARTFDNQTEELVISRENRSDEENGAFDIFMGNNIDLIARMQTLRDALIRLLP